MKAKLLKKIGTVSLLTMMVMTMTACGGSDKKAEQTEKNEQSEDTVHLTTVKITDSSQKFVDCTPDDNAFQDDFLKDLNIDVEYKWIADITQTDAKFATMVASGDIPDYFNVANADLAFQLINDGYCMDITDVYEKTASDALKARDAAFPEAQESMKRDGKLFGISELGFGVKNELNLVWIRKDWLEKSGYEAPKTVEELNSLAEYFVNNIEGCQYGISLSKEITSFTEHTALPIMNAYDAYAKIWIDGEKGIEYSSIQPEMKTALGALQQMYKKGIIDKEFTVKDISAVNEDVAAGKVGIVCGVNWIGWDSLAGTVALDKNATWLPIEVPTLEKDAPLVKLQSGWPVGGYWLISKDCENPEAVIEMMNYFVEREDSGTFNTEPYNNAGGVYGGSPIYQTNPIDTSKQVREAIEKEDDSQLTAEQKQGYANCMEFLKNGDSGFYGAIAQYGPEGLGSRVVLDPYIENESYVLTKMRGALPEGYALSSGSLNSLEDEYFTRIIMGESIDLFDEFVEKWKANGGTEATEEVNKMYNK